MDKNEQNPARRFEDLFNMGKLTAYADSGSQHGPSVIGLARESIYRERVGGRATYEKLSVNAH